MFLKVFYAHQDCIYLIILKILESSDEQYSINWK